MVYVSAHLDQDPDQRRRVYRRTVDDLPAHVKDEVFWITSTYGTGYYIDFEAGPEPVEFLEDHWHHLTYDPRDNTYWTHDSDLVEHNEENTGYWHITDPQHPEYQGNLEAALPSNSTTFRESNAPISEDAPRVSPIRFATPPNTEDLEYLDPPNPVEVIHADILTDALEHIATIRGEQEPTPGSPE